MAMMFNHDDTKEYYDPGCSYNLLTVVGVSFNPVRYKVQCLCKRIHGWWTEERWRNAPEYNEKAGRRPLQCHDKCPY